MTRSLNVRAFAKLNVGLKLVARRPDGYHEIRTVYQTIVLHDRLTIELNDARGGISVLAEHLAVPSGHDNLVYRACELWRRARRYSGGIRAKISKRIPVASGLGGGSSDAAAAILGLERLTGDALPPSVRLELAAELGSDVPMFLFGGRVFGHGRGEQVYPLADLAPRRCLVAHPGFAVSTPSAYREASRRLGLRLTKKPEDPSMVFFGVRPLFSLDEWGPAENDFEKVVFAKWPELERVKRGLFRAGAEIASLTGSGSALYAVFASGRSLSRASKTIPSGWKTFKTRTLAREEYERRMFA